MWVCNARTPSQFSGGYKRLWSANNRIAENRSLTTVPGSPFPAGGASPSRWTPLGRFAYVANVWGGVSAFRIGANGALAPVPGSPFPTEARPNLRIRGSGPFWPVRLRGKSGQQQRLRPTASLKRVPDGRPWVALPRGGLGGVQPLSPGCRTVLKS